MEARRTCSMASELEKLHPRFMYARRTPSQVLQHLPSGSKPSCPSRFAALHCMGWALVTVLVKPDFQQIVRNILLELRH